MNKNIKKKGDKSFVEGQFEVYFNEMTTNEKRIVNDYIVFRIKSAYREGQKDEKKRITEAVKDLQIEITDPDSDQYRSKLDLIKILDELIDSKIGN